MADKLEEIYQEFAAAMESYNQSVEEMTAAINNLKATETRLFKVYDTFTAYMGAQAPYDADPDKHGTDPFSLFNRITEGSGGFGGFLKDLGGLF
jgi:hypothetical protein